MSELDDARLRRWLRTQDVEAVLIPLHGSDPVDQIIAAEVTDSFLATIAAGGLSPLERKVVEIVGLQGRDYNAAGALLGVDKKTIDNAYQRARHKLVEPGRQRRAAEVARRRCRVVYVRRLERFTPDGARTKRQAIDAALCMAPPGARVIDCVKRALGPDGRERRDTRGHPRADGRRPVAVWRVELVTRGVAAAA